MEWNCPRDRASHRLSWLTGAGFLTIRGCVISSLLDPRRRKSPALAALCGVFLFALFFFLSPSPERLRGGVSYIPVLKIHKDTRWHPSGRALVAPAAAATLLIPVFCLSFLKLDFKQNLRHWPVIASEFIRSPPFA